MTRYGPIRNAAATAPAPARDMGDSVLAALALKSQGRLEDALSVLTRSNNLAVDSCNLRGDLEMELGRPEDAARSYATALASDPANLHAQYQLGWCFHALADWANSADAFRSVLRLASHRDDARLALGGCLLNLGQYEEALSCFEQCWSSGSRARAEFGKGVALQMSRRFDEAERAYAGALVLNPLLIEALSNLVAMSLEVFDLNRVQRYARRLLEMAPDSRIAFQGLALAAIERQDYTEAAQYYSRLIQHPQESAPKKSDSPSATYRLTTEVVIRLKNLLGVTPYLSGIAPLRAPGRKP
jgi:tetratricopeptide (TPR) repeat protein